MRCWGRINYNFRDKFLFTGTVRVDGSSKFGTDNKYGVFPSAALGWRLDKEQFIKNLNLFSNLKLRVSLGKVGNDRIPNYQSLAILGSGYYPLNNNPVISAWPNVIPNPSLQWETTTSRNIGLDIGLFKGRLQLTFEAYRNTTDNLLLNTQIPLSTGYSNMIKNIGKTRNQGIEISLSSANIDRDKFKWNTDFNISFNRNKILALSGEDYFLRSSEWSRAKDNDYIIKEGSPIGLMYGYVSDGIYNVSDFNYDKDNRTFTIKDNIPYQASWTPQPGYWKLKDISGPEGKADGKITPDDRTVIGNANPKFYGGMTNTFSYGNFDLSVFLNWSYGFDVYNANKIKLTMMSKLFQNQLSIVKNRWSTVDENGHTVMDPEQLALSKEAFTYPIII